MLPGSSIGIKYYIYPDLSKLQDIQIWKDAASICPFKIRLIFFIEKNAITNNFNDYFLYEKLDQIFFTLSVSYGGLVMLSSYNDFKKNVLM